MLDLTAVRDGKVSIVEFAAKLTPDDLSRATDEMVDTLLDHIAGCTDADVTFVPEDPLAHDSFASSEDEVRIAWTLGHVLVHITATSEEAAAIAAELARGVAFRGGRSRREIPWRSVTTIAQCRHRLEESRRMRLASLDMWPDEPDLANTYQPSPSMEPRNALTRFVLGLKHDTDHLNQIAEIVRQAQAARR